MPLEAEEEDDELDELPGPIDARAAAPVPPPPVKVTVGAEL